MGCKFYTDNSTITFYAITEFYTFVFKHAYCEGMKFQIARGEGVPQHQLCILLRYVVALINGFAEFHQI